MTTAVYLTKKLYNHTLRRKSEPDQYADLKLFLALFPAVSVLTLSASKNLSKVEVNRTVSVASSPPYILRALEVLELSTLISDMYHAGKPITITLHVLLELQDQLSSWSMMSSRHAHTSPSTTEQVQEQWKNFHLCPSCTRTLVGPKQSFYH